MIRRTTAVLALLVLLSAGVVAGGQPTRSAAPPVYIALGDSIAAGIGSSLPRERGYPALVNDFLDRQTGQDGILEMLAVPGETATTFRDDGQLARFHDLIDRLGHGGNPIVAISVSLGGNDLLGVSGSDANTRQSALDAFRDIYPAVLADIRATAGPATPLVVTNYYDLSAGDPSIAESDAWWVAQFNTVIADAASASSARVADVATAFTGHIADFTLEPVDIHPTNAGHRTIANLVWRALALDTSAPMIEVPATIDSSRQTPTLRFSTRDDTGVADVAIESADVSVHGPYRVGGDWVVLLDLNGLADPSVITIRASDDAGNTTERPVTVNPPNQTP